MSHPLEKFNCCPSCGSHSWREHDFKSKECADCGFVYYANAAASTAAFILRTPPQGGEEEELLVVSRAKEPAKGTLDLPGGFVDMGETAEEGMLREVEEETGMRLDGAAEFLFTEPNQYVYSGMTIHTIDLFFLFRTDSSAQPRAADDAADCRWIRLSQVRPEDFGLGSISRAVSRFLSGRQPAQTSE